MRKRKSTYGDGLLPACIMHAPCRESQPSTIINGDRYFECPLCKGYFDTFHLFEGFGPYKEVFVCVGCMRKLKAKIAQAKRALGEAREE